MATLRSILEKQEKYDASDLLTVDYAPGMDDSIKRRAKRRKSAGAGEGEGGPVGEAVAAEEDHLEEGLTFSQRRDRSLRAKRNKAKLLRGRERAERKTATQARLKGRSIVGARAKITNKLTRGVSKGDLSAARKSEIEDRIHKMAARVKIIANRLLPVVRKRDQSRRLNANK